jgi:hypothetical protein
MKKIGKISINPEKVIKNEELVNLKGGDYGGCCICGNGRSIYGPTNDSQCRQECKDSGFGAGTWVC